MLMCGLPVCGRASQPVAWRSVGAAWEKPDAGGLAQRGSRDHSGPFTYGGYDLKPPTNTDYLFPDTKKAEPISRTEALTNVDRVEPHPVIFHSQLQVFPDTTERDCRVRCVRVFPNVAEQFPDDTKDHDARVVSQRDHLIIGSKMEAGPCCCACCSPRLWIAAASPSS